MQPFPINQSGSASGTSLFFQIIHAQREATLLIKDFISRKALPLKIEQVFVFLGIYNLGVATQKEIADYVLRDKASVQRTVAKLLSHNLVKASPDRHDKRKCQISLTDKGKQLATDIRFFLGSIEEQYLVALQYYPFPGGFL